MGNFDDISQKIQEKFQKVKGEYGLRTGDPVKGSIKKKKGGLHEGASDFKRGTRHRNGEEETDSGI